MARVRIRRGRRRRITPGELVVWTFAAAVMVAWLVSLARRHPPPPRRSGALSAQEARIANAAIPLAPGPVRPARPYRFRGTPAAREQAIRCLAVAGLYEAGDDPAGQRAVMQVILNRARSPGYPATVCGVVYQGATLPTGCQFSFACDGSVTRRPEHAGWKAARTRARRALSGAVDRTVGTSTHYHGDYVVPYWIGSLAKTAIVDRHIFYRPRAARGGNPSVAAGATMPD